MLVGEKTDFGSPLSWRPTYKGRERGEGGREALVLHKAPFHQSREEGGSRARLEKLQPNPAACALQAAAAWQQGQESSSASIKALSTSTRSKQGLPRTSQGLSQVPKYPAFLAEEVQRWPASQKPVCPTKRQKPSWGQDFGWSPACTPCRYHVPDTALSPGRGSTLGPSQQLEGTKAQRGCLPNKSSEGEEGGFELRECESGSALLKTSTP